ncbi:WD40 repeat-like protein [Suillus brevipes Sb2]|nr:WD40 repeat-like protein [Suillus brevipes Sb2]
MASTSTQPVGTADKSILRPVMTLEGHEPWNTSLPDGKQDESKYVSYISYFPDGKQMISGSYDKTIRRWDLRKGKEIEKDREVSEYVGAVRVSRDGRWVVIAGGRSLKVSEVETGIVRTFDEGDLIYCIDISVDSTLLAGASFREARIWNLDTGELVAGPFVTGDYFPRAVRLSGDSCKLAVSSYDSKQRDPPGRHSLQVWDVQTQKLNVQKSTGNGFVSNLPIFWTTNDKSIVAAFNTTDHYSRSICECDASTLKSVGAPFKHTASISSLALSSDCVLLASASYDRTIKLWAFESRQLLASFDVKYIVTLVLSPDSRQLAYTTLDDTKIHIYDIPANILANVESFPATSPLPRSHIPRTSAPPTTQYSAINTSPTLTSRLYRLWPIQSTHASPTIVDVPLAPGKLRIAAAGAPGDDDDLIRDEDYVPPPSPSPNSHPGIANAGQHGSGRFCFCF